jgi:radical SAM superfamily enzyme YgiQ (UPF0313 family)
MPFERPAIIRPPSEHGSYFLPLTSGCSNHTCTFCGYCGSRLKLRGIDKVKEEIDALALYMKHGIRLPSMPDIVYEIASMWDGRRVFLQDADALVYPFLKLKEVLACIKERLPYVERVGIYATPQDVLRLGLDELRELWELRLGIIYMGIESGDDEVLQMVSKGVGSRNIVEAGRRVREAGIALSVTVILGLGGIERSQSHALNTARILSEVDPDYGGALTLMLIPGTPLYEEKSKGNFHPLSPFESLRELKVIVENSKFSNCFFSSMHASNYVAIRGRLPQDKGKMLHTLEEIIEGKDASRLRPEFIRGL